LIKSRFRYHYEYNGLIILGLFLAGIIFKVSLSDEPLTKKDTSMLAFGTFIVFIGFSYTLYKILRVPSVQITNYSITLKSIFGTKTISWDEIQYISFPGKYGQRFGAEATVIYLKTHKEFRTWLSFYANEYEIQSALEKANECLSKHSPVSIDSFYPIKAHTTVFYDSGKFIKFAGNPHTSVNGLLFYGILCSFLFLSINKTLSISSLIFLIPLTVSYVGFGTQLHYFLLSGDELIVRNHFFFWKKHTYSLSEVTAIVFETPYKSSKSLRLIKKDFREKLYSAGSLRKKHWKQLKERIGELGIEIRNYN
jgi:hypothetical protein